MRMMVFFDLPVTTKAERRAYTLFRRFLLTDGYDMIQFSVYGRILNGGDAGDGGGAGGGKDTGAVEEVVVSQTAGNKSKLAEPDICLVPCLLAPLRGDTNTPTHTEEPLVAPNMRAPSQTTDWIESIFIKITNIAISSRVSYTISFPPKLPLLIQKMISCNESFSRYRDFCIIT